jgi:hypothetical protein
MTGDIYRPNLVIADLGGNEIIPVQPVRPVVVPAEEVAVQTQEGEN